MIKFENYEVMGWEHAIRGMRNPMNSWAKSDSAFCTNRTDCSDCPMNDHKGHCLATYINGLYVIGPNDHELMMKLRNAGTDHRKFMRQIIVYVDITAPLYWWKEFDTYKVGTVANSCSTMHKIHEKEFTVDDFSCEKLITDRDECWATDLMAGERNISTPADILFDVVYALNIYRNKFVETKDKRYWHQMIQLLPTSYNQKRTVMLNYEVLANMYKSRKNHKLDEWRELCKWIESLPYSEVITGETVNGAPSDGNGRSEEENDG